MNIFVLPRQLTLDTAPAAEPVSLSEMKAHLRVDYTDDDSLIGDQITEAREWMEKALNLSMVHRTYTAKIDGFYECIELPAGPVSSVTAVKYWSTDSPSVLTTLADSSVSPVVTSDVYRVDTDQNRIYRAQNETWPDAAVRHDSVQITFVAGYAAVTSPLDFSLVPGGLKAALKLLVGDMYENRENTVIGRITSELPTAKRLLQSHREY